LKKKAKLKIYPRADRFYGDFRAWKDVGGAREPLVPEGATLATTDRKEAEELYLRRAAQLGQTRKKRQVLGEELGISRTATLKAYGAHHLRQKAKSGGVTERWLTASESHLRHAVEFFGPGRELHEILVADVQKYSEWLLSQPVWRNQPLSTETSKRRTLSAASARKYLNTLSNLFRRAQAENVVPLGHNPVALMMERPTAAPQEARWFEMHEAALYLEAARAYTPKREDTAMPFAYPLIATFLLTGGRQAEVLGLEVEDVSFDRRTITFRPHKHRRLKTLTSFRTVPLHPQLEEILREYLFGGETPRVSGLLFPSDRAGEGPSMLTDARKLLDAVAERAGWKAGEIRTKMFRHTYCAARLQCLDRGAPIALYTVAKEMGHGGDSMVRRVYGHLGQVRHRSEAVEYRIEQHQEVPGFTDRVRSLSQS
jgi:integrase